MEGIVCQEIVLLRMIFDGSRDMVVVEVERARTEHSAGDYISVG